MIVYEPRIALIAWAEARIPGSSFTDRAHAIGLDRAGKLIAVAVFDLFTDYDCELSFAAAERRWFDPEFANATFSYPFLQLGLERLSTQNPLWNRPARILARAMGFRIEGLKRRLDPNEHRVLLGMMRSERRYLKGTHHGL